jgi:peptidoglycan/LPS O-acetylase OafA/YrhL
MASRGTASDRTVRSVQALRGGAALFVLLFHAGLIFGADKYWGAHLASSIFLFGKSGVHFFFVISGYIIALAHERDVDRPDRLGRYARRRIVRIFPVYWIVTLGALGGVMLVPSLADQEPSARALLGSFTLLPFAGNNAILSVAWSLFHEVAFYFAFGLLILDRRVGLLVFAVWAAAILFGVKLPNELSYLVSPINLLFLIGIGSFYVLKHVRIPVPLITTLSGFGAFLVLGANAFFDGFPAVLLGAAAAVTLVGFVELERSGGLRVPAAFELLGNASYSLYLVHFPLLSLEAKIATWLRFDFIPIPVYFVGLTSGTVLVALGFYFAVEKPLLSGLRSSSPVRLNRAQN